MRKVFFENSVSTYRGNISWNSIVGKTIGFVYDEISGDFYISAYDKNSHMLDVKYKGSSYRISSDSFRKARISNIIHNIYAINESLALCIVENVETKKKLTCCSEKTVNVRCPNCGQIKIMKVKDLYKNGVACRKCGDGISYPEKYLFEMLTELEVDFECQKRFGKYYYDFWLPGFNMVIEANGMQHYDPNNSWYRAGVDKTKTQFLIANGINCVSVDCRLSDKDYIKDSIENSDLRNVFDLSIIDYDKCDFAASCSLLIKACKLFDEGYDIDSIAKEIDSCVDTVRRYLQRGEKLGITSFKIQGLIDSRKKRAREATIKACSKEIVVCKDGVDIGIYDSIAELCRKSKSLDGYARRRR